MEVCYAHMSNYYACPPVILSQYVFTTTLWWKNIVRVWQAWESLILWWEIVLWEFDIEVIKCCVRVWHCSQQIWRCGKIWCEYDRHEMSRESLTFECESITGSWLWISSTNVHVFDRPNTNLTQHLGSYCDLPKEVPDTSGLAICVF